VNAYTEFTNEEFMQYYNLKDPQQDCSATHTPSPILKTMKADEIPESFDWRNNSGVTPVKD